MMTSEEAIAFADRRDWEKLTPSERAMFQLGQEFLAMPFSIFHEGMEELLGRPVWTHEFADRARLLSEAEGKTAKASFSDVYAMLCDLINKRGGS